MAQGERIKELRKALNLTLEKFGERLGVGKTAISKLEKGERNLTDQMCKSICREFNVNEAWLRDGEGEMFQIPDDEDAALISEILEHTDRRIYQAVLNIVRTYSQLSPESQRALDVFVDQLLENAKNRKD